MSLTAHLVLGSVQLSYSGWHVVSALASRGGADPFIFASYRSLCSLLLMLLLVKLRGKKLTVQWRDWKVMLLMGACSFINSVFTILALRHISPLHYSIMQPVIPAVATLISVLYGMEQMTTIKAGGILCAITGAVVSKLGPILMSNKVENAMVPTSMDQMLVGNLLVVAQVCSMGALIVLQKSVINRYDSTVLAFSYYFVATVITIVISTCFVLQSNGLELAASLLNFSGQRSPWVALLYATFSTFYTNNAYAWSSKLVKPSVTAIYNTFQPVFTAVLSFVFLNEAIGFHEVIGGCFVILGMLITLHSQTSESAEKKTS